MSEPWLADFTAAKAWGRYLTSNMTIKLAHLTERRLLGIKMTENHNYLHENILDDLLKINEMVRPKQSH